MKVREVMAVDLATAQENQSLPELVDLMVEHGVGGVPVVDEVRNLVGIATRTDVITKPVPADGRDTLAIVRAVLGDRHHSWVAAAIGLTVGDIMTRAVVTVEPWEDIQAASRRLSEHGIGRLAVVDEESQLIGMVSRRELLRPPCGGCGYGWPKNRLRYSPTEPGGAKLLDLTRLTMSERVRWAS